MAEAEVGAHAHPPQTRNVEWSVDEFISPGEKSVLQPTREQCDECVIYT